MKATYAQVVRPAPEPARYGIWHVLLDLSAVSAFVSAMTLLLISLALNSGKVWGSQAYAEWLLPLVVLLALLAADFVSGFVHFLADNFGNPDTPIFGRVFVFPFREHHGDPKAITRHSYLETNGANCLISLPVIISVLCFTSGEEDFFLRLFAFFFLAAIFFTNQIHKWAHTDAPPVWVCYLQKWGLVLSPENHSVHHTAPHDEYYCITGGWLNAALKKMRFFSAVKWILTAGKKP